MTATAQQVLKDALGLSPVDRAELIERLFRSFDRAADTSIDAAWGREAESRFDAHDEGKLAASSAEEVLKRIAQR
jgi:putative addiction module component (TIGR02574 family)